MTSAHSWELNSVLLSLYFLYRCRSQRVQVTEGQVQDNKDSGIPYRTYRVLVKDVPGSPEEAWE